MIKIIIKITPVMLCLSLFAMQQAVAADVRAVFVKELYKQAYGDAVTGEAIYHTIQVHTVAGPKVLILTGKDTNHRKWFRYLIALGTMGACPPALAQPEKRAGGYVNQLQIRSHSLKIIIPVSYY